MNNYYVYRHRRIDTFQVFYVGIGAVKDFKRAYQKDSRNRWWKNITKVTDYQVEIIQINLSKEEACELEMFLISQYGRKDSGRGNLCNMTDGGEGTSGFKSEEHKIKIGNANRGKVRPIDKRNWGEKNYMFGRKGELCPSFGIVRDQTYKDKISKENQGKTHTQEWKDNRSDLLKGSGNPRAKKVIDTKTGIVYECAKDVADLFNIKYENLVSYLNPDNGRSNKTSFQYV